MQHPFKNNLIRDFFKERSNLDISRYDGAFLDKSINTRMTGTNCKDEAEYLQYIEKNPDESVNLSSVLNVCYSEFFRNPLTFSVLEKIIIPNLHLRNKIIKRKEIRVWSAACAAGQEAYSIAILLEEFKALSGEKFDYRIFATDISEEQINLAKKGQYSETSIGNLSLARINSWFTKKKGNREVIPEIKQNIDFSVFDLFCKDGICPPASIYGDFDLVFCSNVLFYYDEDSRKKIVSKAGHCLKPEGFLITGEAERNILMNLNYHEVFSQSAIFQKNTGPSQMGNKNIL